ncbi:MAG: cytidine deaminase [Candidatus Obscuribacterales bacterium]
MITEKEKTDLLQAASDVSARAYAPYSKLNRGAAVLTESGEIFRGCNVEIASFGGSLCAEMSAVSAAVAANQRRIKAIALNPPAYPCGICRQMLVEFGIDIEVVIEENGSAKVIDLQDLLPFNFGPQNLTST